MFFRMVFNYIKCYFFLCWQFFSLCRWSFVSPLYRMVGSFSISISCSPFFSLFVSVLIHIGGAHKFRQCSALQTFTIISILLLYYSTLCALQIYMHFSVRNVRLFLLLHFSFFFFFVHIVCWSSGRFNVATDALFFPMSSFVFNFFPPVFFLVRGTPICSTTLSSSSFAEQTT